MAGRTRRFITTQSARPPQRAKASARPKLVEGSRQKAKAVPVLEMESTQPEVCKPVIPEEGAAAGTDPPVSATAPKSMEELLVWLVQRQELSDQRRKEEEKFYREKEQWRRDKEEEQRRIDIKQQEVERARRDEQFIQALQAMQQNLSPATKLKLTKLTETDDIESYLKVFERVAQANKWPEDQWVLHLVPFLTSKAQQAYSQMRTDDAENYKKVKTAILRRYNIHTETFRQKFRTYSYQDKDGPREAYTQLSELCSKWIPPEGKTVQQVLQTIILEQFLEVLPTPMRIWVKEHQPDSGEQAVTLAENYLLARKGLVQKPSVVRPSFNTITDKPKHETVKSKGQHKDLTCFACGKAGHYAKDCTNIASKKVKGSAANCVGLVRDYLQPVTVNSQTVTALIDTGSQQSLIRSDLVDSANTTGHLFLTCVHGDKKMYPKTVIPIQIADVEVSLEMGIVPKLPYPVVLGQDLPGFCSMIKSDSVTSAVTTRSQVKKVSDAESLGDIFPLHDDVFHGSGKGHLSRREMRLSRAKWRSAHSLLEKGSLKWENMSVKQKQDGTLASAFSQVKNEGEPKQFPMYTLKNDLLYRVCEHPILYISRKLFPRELNYSTIEKECLAIKWAIESLRYYLLGKEFVLISDHHPLFWLNTMKGNNARLTRWYLGLQPYRFLVQYKPGSRHKNADHLSRFGTQVQENYFVEGQAST
ncbi:uncharacterized protein [Engystomops pustulosus]|uniref:uncharacterized protein n=1 Tax=Engystomops pustulosus TaxID=76066 RepID=UPI003AFAC119